MEYESSADREGSLGEKTEKSSDLKYSQVGWH